MYEKFYGLSEKPFRIVPNPNFLYLTPKHQDALTTLEYGVSEGVGFTLLTGDIGTGKTTLIRYLLNQIEHDMDIAVIFNTNVSGDQLLNLILQEFELEPDEGNKAKTLDSLYQYLIKMFSENRKVLLIIDEAQNLSREALEEVRMLSNLQSDDHLLLNIMLVGQPELKAKLEQPGLTQFSQRIAVNYHLTGLGLEDVTNYIHSRLEKVGGAPDLFDSTAVEAIYQAARGIPRAINQICDSALVYGYADEKKVIGGDIIEQVLADRGDLGLPLGEPAGATSVVSQSSGNTAEAPADLLNRIRVLEHSMATLQYQVDHLVSGMEKKLGQQQQDTVKRLQDLLVQERKRSDSLLSGYARLNQKYLAMQWSGKQDSRAIEPDATDDDFDLDLGGED